MENFLNIFFFVGIFAHKACSDYSTQVLLYKFELFTSGQATALVFFAAWQRWKDSTSNM